MESAYSTPFSKATLTGVFAGIVTTVLCMVYNIIFRDKTGFELSDIINVSSLIFVINFVFFIVGMIYYVFLQMKYGELVYAVVFLLITVWCAYLAGNAHRSDSPLLNKEFHQLLVPMVIAMGLAAAIGVPLLFHSKKFREHVI